MDLQESLKFLGNCGYSLKKTRIDEMSRASDRTLGATSNANLLYKLADWKKGYDRSGKSPTLGALKKFLDDNSFTWDQVKNVDFDLPDNAPATTARKTFDLAQLVRCLASENELDLDTVRSNVEQGKDEYDKLIDTFWDYYEKEHDGSDVSEFVQTPEFKAVVDLFKDDPEKAQEVFGRNYEKALGYLSKFLDPDYESSPKGLISAFWDWYRAKKAGQDIDFPADKAEALARVLEGVNPQQYFSNSGLYFFVNRTVGNMVGRRLEPADEDFDYGSFDNDFSV